MSNEQPTRQRRTQTNAQTSTHKVTTHGIRAEVDLTQHTLSMCQDGDSWEAPCQEALSVALDPV